MLLHFWVLLFGIISIFLIYKVGCQLFNQKVGLISSFISSISYFHIYYSQEARMYSLFLMLTLLSFYLFIKILKSDTPKISYFAFLLLTNIALAYTHVYGPLVIASQVFYILLFWNKYKQVRFRFLGVQIATAAIFSLWLPMFWKGISRVVHHFWIPEPSLSTIVDTIKNYSGSEWGQLPIWYILAAFLFLSLIGLFAIRRVNGHWTWTPRESILLLVWFAFSIIIPFVISLVITPIYWTRYTISTVSMESDWLLIFGI